MKEIEFQKNFEKLSGSVKIINKLWLKLIVFGAVGMVAAGIANSSFYFEGTPFIAALILCAAAFLTGFVLRSVLISKKKKLKALISENVTRNILETVFEVSEYSAKDNIKASVIRSANLIIDDWHRCTGNDFVRGCYKGHKIQFSDVMLEEEVQEETRETDDDGATSTRYHTTYEKRFKGQWIIIEMSKEFSAWLRLREKGKREFLKSNIETENVAFNKQFQIETSDPHTAFLILTPHFMEVITAADQKAHGKTFMFFSGREIHIAIDNNRDLFDSESKNKKTEDISELRESHRNDIKYLTDIMDLLMKNEKLF